ncbi:MAG: PBP1A family penicillin-binding protein [Candidatus Nitronauta litoralis]|uniref:Penicillin-binding protein 1A n=1 Tax=Candidatus Nitronauta litoralis TaxID=2705533 RepID=A0A7T0BYZ8_9BACT|nr:MAG: PBP1A family penicillin-binding protein [Candidatus Nitronauta litoralis]
MSRILDNQPPVTFRRKLKKKKKKKPGFKKLMLVSFLSLFLLVLFAGFVGAGFIFFYYSQDLPDVRSLKEYQPSTITRVYSDQDDLIAEFYIEKRIIVPLKTIPKLLKQATLAVEDSNFYSHFGIDPKAIFRAFLTNIQAGHVVEGGSTITQQLSKTLFLSSERSLERKIREAILSVRMELVFSKDEILEMYLNNIYYGHGSYGVEAAARTYFGKSVKDLTLVQCAALAALPKAPNNYSPYRYPEKSLKRRTHVLKRMVIMENITPEEREAALKAPLQLGEITNMLNKAPYFVEHIRQFLQENYGSNKLYRDGLNVYTTLNLPYQEIATAAVQKGLLEADKRYGYRGPISSVDLDGGREAIMNSLDQYNKFKEGHIPESGDLVHAVVLQVFPKEVDVDLGFAEGSIALEKMNWARKPNIRLDGRWARIKNAHQALKPGDLVQVRLLNQNQDGDWALALEQTPEVQGGLISLNPLTGQILSMVGGYDFQESQFNRAIQAIRQPGSAFKPIIYTAALQEGYTPASIIIDAPVIFNEKEDTFDKWKPVNFEEKFYGPTSIRTALTHSRNVVTIKLLQNTGVQKAIDLARQMGIKSPMSENLSIALGSSGLTLYELVSAYSIFANGGKKVEPTSVRHIINRDDEVIYRATPSEIQVISPGMAYLITSLLQSVVQHGTATKVKALGRPVAGKTGTTNNFVDAWFMGYTPEMVTGVWVGKDKDEPLGQNETGSRAAIPIWLDYMKKAMNGKPIMDFPVPDDVMYIKIDPETGSSAEFDSPSSKFEVFLKDNPPEKGKSELDPMSQNTF